MARVLLLTILLVGPLSAGAQVLPGSPLRGLPGGLPAGLPGALLPGIAQQAADPLGDTRALEDARKLRIRLLLRRHADVLEADPRGAPIVRGEVLAYSPSDATLGRARSAGFPVLREASLAALGVRIVVLGTPPGTPTSRALELLRRLDPQGTFDFNNIYTDSGVTATGGATPLPAAAALATPAAGSRSDVEATSASGSRPDVEATSAAGAIPAVDALVRVGLIDGGVGTRQSVFKDIVIHQQGCDGAAVPSDHGTEVASLMVGRSARFAGAAPGAPLYAADVYCAKPTGGSVDAIAEAMAWLVGERVQVINVSLVGPPNALLQQVIEGVVARGFLIVAAVGNDGPAAPPLYPAAYPGVIGVTAVDHRRRVLFEAERGPQVMFAAPGADIVAASASDGFESVRGTSFAAPIVAGLLARQIRSGGDPDPKIDPGATRSAVEALIRQAIPLGAHGRNVVFGYGLVGADLPSPGTGSRQ